VKEHMQELEKSKKLLKNKVSSRVEDGTRGGTPIDEKLDLSIKLLE
jgi:hypothetical protein